MVNKDVLNEMDVFLNHVLSSPKTLMEILAETYDHYYSYATLNPKP